MFDRIIVSPVQKHSHTHHTTHTEHRAPTDASVKLLMEMEKAALDKLLGTVVYDDNEFKATWSYFSTPGQDVVKATCRFSLNGKEHRIELDLNAAMAKYDTVARGKFVADKVRTAIIEKLAGILMLQLVTVPTGE